jgi:hypothetical protein
MSGEFDGFSVVLRPHIGVKMSALGPVKIEHDQWLVLVDASGVLKQVGYVTKKPDAPLRWIPYRGEAVSEYGQRLVDHVEKLCAAERDKALGIAAEVTTGYSE